LLLDVLAVGRGLFPGQADQQTARRLGGVALEKLEHVAAGLGDGGHLGDDWQIVDDEGDFVLLVARQVLGVTEEAEAGDVGGAVGVVLVHEAGAGAVQSGHGIHAALVGFTHVLLGDDELDAVPALRLVEPLVGVDCDLGTQRLREDEDVADDSGVGDDELVGLAHGGGNSADGAPGVHDCLSAGDRGAGLQGAILVSAHH